MQQSKKIVSVFFTFLLAGGWLDDKAQFYSRFQQLPRVTLHYYEMLLKKKRRTTITKCVCVCIIRHGFLALYTV